MTASSPRSYRFPRPEQRGVLLGLRPPQVAVLGCAVTLAIAAVMAVPSATGLILGFVVVLVGAPAAVVRVEGKTLDEWLPILARWTLVLGRRRKTWISGAPTQGDSAEVEWAEPPPPLAGVKLLRVRRPGDAEIAVVADRRTGMYSSVIACKGQPFALLDSAEQDRLAALWGQALASFAQEGSPVARLAWVERALPEEGDALAAYLDEHATVEAEHPAYASYRGLIEAAGPVTQAHETYLVLSVGGPRARRAMRQAGGGDAGACEVLVREVSTLVERLRRAEVEVADIADARHLAAVVRSAFDPSSIRPIGARSRREPSRAGASGRNAWPLATRVEWDHYRTDSGVHATFWVAEFPRRDVDAAFLFPLLLYPSGMRSVAVVMEPVPPSKAARAVESAHASHVADEKLRGKAGYLPSARRRKEHDAILEREAELAEGHAEYRFSAYVTVTAPTVDQLEFAVGEAEQRAFDAGLELRRLYGEQDDAFTYTLPLARGLR